MKVKQFPKSLTPGQTYDFMFPHSVNNHIDMLYLSNNTRVSVVQYMAKGSSLGTTQRGVPGYSP